MPICDEGAGAPTTEPRESPVNPVASSTPDSYGHLMTHHENHESHDEMSREQKRHDQLTSAPDATEADAAPRVEVSEHDGTTRIDILPDAAVRPGPGPGAEPAGDDAGDEAGDNAAADRT